MKTIGEVKLRNKLKKLREGLNFTQAEAATAVGISKKHYQSIEQGRRFPSEHVLKRLLKVLNTDSLSVLENEETVKRGEVSKNICNYMNQNSLDNKKYTVYEVNAIRSSIQLELKDRKVNCISIKLTEDGKTEINTRIANISNEIYKTNITHVDVSLWRRCSREEYTDRTGKCTWGIAEVRKKLGFNGITGYELKD